MWISVKNLAAQLNISTRAVQKMIAEGQVVARKKNKKTYEVDTSTLPQRHQAHLPEVMRAVSLPRVAITQVISSSAATALGRTLTRKERIKAEVVKYYEELPVLQTQAVRIGITAKVFSISPSSVRRYIKELEQHGVLGKPKEGKKSKWTDEAKNWMIGWYLNFIKTTSVNSKQAAYDAVSTESLKRGWTIGCRSSAYAILSDIPKLMVDYATAGNRSLDNYFYIKRDWNSLKPSQIWIGDQHVCDFWVVDKTNPDKWRYFRPTIYAWEDGATRMITGIAVDENYTSDTVIESIRVGIHRFGFFENTYNDNGTSECSKAATQIIDDLIILSDNRSHMRDVSDLYRNEDGVYVVEDAEGRKIGATDSLDSWRRQHRRIYARVKNAKTKPIERLFGTIETKMAQRGVPGHVVTPGAPADQEEKESQVLARAKANDWILTLEEFMVELIKGIDEYEHSYHSTLKMSPREKLAEYISKGWAAKRPANPKDLDFIFLSRASAIVRKGRVTINKRMYIGEDLGTSYSNVFPDVGLSMHENEKVEVRYDKYNPDIAYAVFPNSDVKIRALKPVRPIDMLDDQAMKKGIEWKRHQMKVVREAFTKLAIPITNTLIESKLSVQIEEADRKIADIKQPRLVPPALHKASANRSNKALRLHASDDAHYEWCLIELANGNTLDPVEREYMNAYECTDEYKRDRSYWDSFRDFYMKEDKE